MNKLVLSPTNVLDMVEQLAIEVGSKFSAERHVRIYGVPRGGVPVALALAARLGRASVAQFPDMADIIVDDIIDTGKTADQFDSAQPFYALVSKKSSLPLWQKAMDLQDPQTWVEFPWEKSREGDAEDTIVRLLQQIGEDASRPGLIETPARVVRAWAEWTIGYSQEPSQVLKTFEDGAEKVDEMVIVRDIEFYSHCEHHLAPFFGRVHIGYVPDGKIVGLSKLPRLVDIFARRLQVQERMTNQIADALSECLKPKGVAVVAEARHLCMESRGRRLEGSKTVTSAMRGVFMDKPEARNEFLTFIR